MTLADRLVIAIDGPSGSGKSSTSREVARRLGIGYLDTGAMYRAVAVAFLDSGVAVDDTAGIIEATRSADIQVSLDPDQRWVRVNGRDVTEEIREPRTSENVSAVSTIPECRADLVERQRALMDSAPDGVVAEGRDITTVVYPDADLRILLTASPEARLRRRRGDLDPEVTEDELRDQVLRRDEDDSKLVEFQTAAEGVTLLDTSDMGFEQVVQTIIDMARDAGRADA
ncbi:(d)CMP kinase [Nigerium massiliense]|uniref:(d)CMP kinase n=1 Tax=Nigerium massiliense TaxID=1522317 RepID=UPI0005903621|nr:(d)CMP kinase [Nigerium massiliense]